MTLNRTTGAILWITSLQYFIIQLLVASRWTHGFSLRHNTISDLGNSVCGMYDGRIVCSPMHTLMNISLIFLGITQFLGALFFYSAHKQKTTRLGFVALAFAGIGTLVVGLFPENTISWLHGLGAAMPFLVGNIGLITLGFSLKFRKPFKTYTILSGAVALMALAMFLTHNYFSLGLGGMERLTAYPQTVWLIAFGIFCLYSKKVPSKN